MTSTTKLLIVLALLALGAPGAFAQTAVSTIALAEEKPDTRAEIIVSKTGAAHISGFKVVQRAGSSYFGRLYWGDTYLRVSLRGNSKTLLRNRFEEPLQPADINVGDMLSADGELLSGTSEFSVNAVTIHNLSYEKNHRQFDGTVMSIDTSASSFMLATTAGTVQVHVGPTADVDKGTRSTTGTLQLLAIGDKVLRVRGVFDRTTGVLEATDVTAFFDVGLLKPKTYQGILAATPSPGATELQATMAGQTYRLKLTAKTQVHTLKRKPITLARFVEGDKISFYGAREEADPSTINIDIIRNLDL